MAPKTSQKLIDMPVYGGTESPLPATTAAPPIGYLTSIALDQLQPGPWQPRTKFDQEKLQELADSIKAEGIRDPLQVRMDVQGKDLVYRIISGERRYRASKLAGLAELPCIVQEDTADDTRLRRLALLANMHRADLSVLEEARALAQLAGAGMSQREMATQLGKTQGWVSQRLSLLRLPDKALEALDNGVITVEDARELVKLAEEPKVLDMVLAEDDRKLQKLVNNGYYGYIGHRITDRVKAVMDWKSREGDFQAKIEKLQRQGHVVVEDFDPHKSTSKYAMLSDGTVDDQAHKKAGLTCEAVAVVRGYSNYRVCTDPSALRKAVAELKKSGEIVEPSWKVQERERKAIEDARDQARLVAIQSWLRNGAPIEGEELTTVAKARVADLAYYDNGETKKAARWLGFELGGTAEGSAALVREYARGSDEKLMTAWFLLELVNATRSYSRPGVIAGVDAWLHAYGYIDPCPEPGKETPDAILARLIEQGADVAIRLECQTCKYQSPWSSPTAARGELPEHAGHLVTLGYPVTEEAPEQDEASGWCGDEGRCHKCEKHDSCNSAQLDGPAAGCAGQCADCAEPCEDAKELQLTPVAEEVAV